MPVGSPLSWGTFLGRGERPAMVGHRAMSHLHHREIVVKAWGKSGNVGGKGEADLVLGPSVGHTDLAKWKYPAIVTAMGAGHQPGSGPPPHPTTPTFPRINSIRFIL